jgi:hypothetical protein
MSLGSYDEDWGANDSQVVARDFGEGVIFKQEMMNLLSMYLLTFIPLIYICRVGTPLCPRGSRKGVGTQIVTPNSVSI